MYYVVAFNSFTHKNGLQKLVKLKIILTYLLYKNIALFFHNYQISCFKF